MLNKNETVVILTKLNKGHGRKNFINNFQVFLSWLLSKILKFYIIQ